MNLLLDTHIWLWSALEPDRLSRRVAKAIAAPENDVWISSVSLWEVLLLSSKGRLTIDGDVTGWIESSLLRGAYREAPLTHQVVLAMDRIDLPHRDPADRFLAATAKCLDLTLVTADENLISGRGYSVLANK